LNLGTSSVIGARPFQYSRFPVIAWTCPSHSKEFLLGEGFTKIDYVRVAVTTTEWLTADKADFHSGYANFIVANVDAGLPILALGGIHPG